GHGQPARTRDLLHWSARPIWFEQLYIAEPGNRPDQLHNSNPGPELQWQHQQRSIASRRSRLLPGSGSEWRAGLENAAFGDGGRGAAQSTTRFSPQQRRGAQWVRRFVSDLQYSLWRP